MDFTSEFHDNSNAYPFLRWAGGKTWLLKNISQYLPNSFNDYHEPFLGGGSVFIYLKSQKMIRNNSFLSDRNDALINAYQSIKDQHIALINLLKSFKNEKEYYYFIREKKYINEIEQAAQFIFLNRTSYNGIFRVNLKGEYNVPYGYKKYTQLFDYKNIINLSKLFENSKFEACDFEDTIVNIKKNDLVFLDPPYTVAHKNNGFVKYNQKIFAWQDQERLKKFIDEIKSRDAYFIMTNAAHLNISNLFDEIGEKHEMFRYSVVGGKGAKRQEISEFVYTNCAK